MKNITFADIEKEIKETNDSRCCTVVAGAVAFEKPFKEMQSLMRAEGRTFRKGLPLSACRRIYKKFADEFNFEYNEFYTESMTVSTAPRRLDPSKNYILFVRGHAVGMQKGRVIDWSEGRRHRVKQVIELTPRQATPETGRVTLAEFIKTL